MKVGQGFFFLLVGTVGHILIRQGKGKFPFIFIYTCSFEFIVMFYLIFVLFAWHSGLSAVIGATSWGATWPGAALDSSVADG
jgi:hypothetical protein